MATGKRKTNTSGMSPADEERAVGQMHVLQEDAKNKADPRRRIRGARSDEAPSSYENAVFDRFPKGSYAAGGEVRGYGAARKPKKAGKGF